MSSLAALAAAAVLLPGFTPAAAGPGGGEFLQGTFPGGDRPGYVYLPPRFDPVHRYPVLYLLHGLPGSPSEYLDGTNFATWADDGIDNGTLRPFIAVMPAAGRDERYGGEWAGPWESALLEDVAWADSTLPTIASPSGRVIAGLSAGGFGAADIGLRHPGLFGTIESWSSYFTPLRDGPFKHVPRATLAANDPLLLARSAAARLQRAGTRFFLSSGPAHSHWFRPAQTIRFAGELRRLDLPVDLQLFRSTHGEWNSQLDAGLAWALSARG